MKKVFMVVAGLLTLVGCTSKPATFEAAIPGPVRTIPAEIQKPALRCGQKAPMVVICHGLTGHRSEMHLTSLADSLQARGIASVRFNFNGHGDDSVHFVHHTISKEVTEAVAVCEYVRSLDWVDTSRIAIAGHSQGGVVAGITAGELGYNKLRALCLLAPAACIHTFALDNNMFGSPFPSVDYEQKMLEAEADPTAEQGMPFWGGRLLGWGYVVDARALDMHALAARFCGPTSIVQGTADSPELIADAHAYTEYMPQAQYFELEGLSHCYPEDYALAAHTAAEWLAGELLK